VARDARVSESVLMTNCVKETNEQLRQASNRTFGRLVASLPAEVARRYGHAEVGAQDLKQLLQAAIAAKDWLRDTELSARLAGQRRSPTGCCGVPHEGWTGG
jgi:hypothetical protein